MKTLAIALVVAALSIPVGFAAPSKKAPVKTAAVRQEHDQYQVKISKTCLADGKTIAPGSYIVVVDGGYATLRKGTKNVLTNIKVETTSAMFSSSNAKFSRSTMKGSHPRLREIDLAGTSEKLMFG